MRSAAILVGLALAVGAAAESPQSFALEVRFASYHPRIDSEPGIQRTRPPGDDTSPFQGPYGRIFGDRGFLLFEIEFDVQVVRLFGTLGVGAALGYFNAVGYGLYSVGGDPALADTRSADQTTLKLVPLRLLAVWRVDEAVRQVNVPLVPYLKLGFGPTLYWVTEGRGGTSWAGGSRGAGSRWGWDASVGLMLLLDFLDPVIARDFDNDWGVNNSYLFAEYRWNRVGTMGRPGFILSDDLATFGAAFEF